MSTSTAVTRRTAIAAAAGTAAVAALASSAPRAAHADESAAAAAPSWLGEEPADGDIVETKECDLLIVGAGNGGMVAAATASDLGVDFLVAEAFDTVQDTRHWIGAVNTKYTEAAGVEVDTTRLQYELARYASFKCNQKIQKVWMNESAELIDWLDTILLPMGWECQLDTEMGDEMDPSWPTGNYIPPVQHMYVNPENGSAFGGDRPHRNVALQQYIEEAGNGERLLWNHELVKLVHDGDKVTGAVFSTDNGNVQINASNVILATGGYPGNPDMVKDLAPIVPQCVTAAGFSPKDRGMGIKAGIWAGGAKSTEPAPMVFNRGVVAPGVNCGYNEDGAFPGTVAQLNLGSQPFMKVSREGTRFANESCPYDFICFAAAEHEGGVWAQIFDANMADDVLRFATDGCSKGTQATVANGKSIDENYAKYLEEGLMFKADTIEELADKLGFEGAAKEAFLAEVKKYNGFYDAQCDADFGKEPYRLSAIRTAPFYGAWYGGTLLTTCDGLKINEEMQVLKAGTCEPIEGLYAVGDCSGSYFANNYPEYVIGAALGRTLTQGRHVVRKLAGDLA